jgi:peptidoglycan/LPS O-acetylase OafA/YrhL
MAFALLDEKKVPVTREVPEYSIHLDAARGAAASVVLVGHLRIFFVKSVPAAPPAASLARSHAAVGATVGAAPRPAGAPAEKKVFGFAHEAVMLFFVLSGFLVGGSVIRMLRQGQWSWKKYLIHRTVRLWMVLIPALAIGYTLDRIGVHYFLGQGTVYDMGPDGPAWDILARLTPLTFLGNLFFLQGARVSPLGTNQPLWSLGYEFWYYVAFPCLALALARGMAAWKRLLLLAGAAAMLAFAGREIAIYFSIWLLGALAALLPLRIPEKSQRLFAGLSLLLILGVNAVSILRPLSAFAQDSMQGFAFFAALYCFLHFRRPSGVGLYRRCARFLSKISYSLYVTHGPVLCMASAVLVGKFRRMPLGGHTALLLAEAMVPVAAVACTVHYLFEARTDQVRRYLEARV